MDDFGRRKRELMMFLLGGTDKFEPYSELIKILVPGAESKVKYSLNPEDMYYKEYSPMQKEMLKEDYQIIFPFLEQTTNPTLLEALLENASGGDPLLSIPEARIKEVLEYAGVQTRDDSSGKICIICGKTINPKKGSRARFCSSKCKNRYHYLKRKAK